MTEVIATVRHRLFLFASIITLFVASFGTDANAQNYEAFPEVSAGSWDPSIQIEKNQKLIDLLEFDVEEVTLLGRVVVAPDDKQLLELEIGQLTIQNGLKAVGVNSPASIDVKFRRDDIIKMGTAVVPVGKGVLRKKADNELVYTLAFESPGAAGLRLSIEEMALPDGVEMYFYGFGDDDIEVHGPYTGRGVNDNGSMWTNTVFDSIGYLEVRAPAGMSADDFAKTSFRVTEVAHMGGPHFFGGAASNKGPTQTSDKLGVISESHDAVPTSEPTMDKGGQESADKSVPSCLTDANCASGDWASANQMSNAIGHMVFAVGSFQALCSGGLLADRDPTTDIPFFLTANHCLSTATSANSLETFFRYKTSQCGGVWPTRFSFPRTLGSQILATRSQTDFTLLRLSQNPPGGSVFLGWSTTKPNTGTQVYRLSHPQGWPMMYSRHEVSVRRFTCLGVSHANMIHTVNRVGETLGGSSGSPIMNSSGQVLGQLLGVCGTNNDIQCTSQYRDTLDGSFADTFPYISQFINNVPPPSVTIITPATNVTIPNDTTTYYITGTADSPESFINLVQWRMNNGTWNSATGTNSWGFVAMGLVVGDNTIEVRSRNIGGVYSTSAFRTITRQAPPPPTVSINNPATNVSLPNGTTSQSFSGTAAATGTTVNLVQWRRNGGTWVNASGTTSWSFNVTSLAVGDTLIEVRSRSASGLYSSHASRIVTRRPAPTPIVQIIDPELDRSVPNATTSYQVTGTAATEDGSINLVQWRRNGGSWISATGTSSWNFNVTNLPVGNTTVEVRSRNNFNLYSTPVPRVITRLPVLPAEPPIVQIDRPRENPIIAHDVSSYTFSGRASAVNASVNLVQWRINGGAWNNATGTTNWSFTASGFFPGGNTIEVRARNSENTFGAIQSRNVSRLNPKSPINIRINQITGASARVSFETPEPARIDLNWGKQPGVYTANYTGTELQTKHSYVINGLDSSTTYYIRVATRDNQSGLFGFNPIGSEMVFTTTEPSDYLTELLTSEVSAELTGKRLTFRPITNRNGYALRRVENAVYTPDFNGATKLQLGDDSSVEVPFNGKRFNFFQEDHTSFFVNSNGNISFDQADSSYDLTNHFNLPRVSALFADLDPSVAAPGGAGVYSKLTADRITIIYHDIPYHGATEPDETVRVQAEFFFSSGEVVLTYGKSADPAIPALVGLSPGFGLPPQGSFWGPFTSDLFNGEQPPVPTKDVLYDFRLNQQEFGTFFDGGLSSATPTTAAGLGFSISDAATIHYGGWARFMPEADIGGGVYKITLRQRSSEIDKRRVATTRTALNLEGFEQNALLVTPSTGAGRAVPGLSPIDQVLYFSFDTNVGHFIPSAQFFLDDLSKSATHSIHFETLRIERFDRSNLGVPSREFSQNLRVNRDGWFGYGPPEFTSMTFTGDANGLAMNGGQPTGGKTLTYGAWVRPIPTDVFEFKENYLYEIRFNFEGLGATDQAMQNHPTVRPRIDASTFEATSLLALESTMPAGQNIPRTGLNRNYSVFYLVPPGMNSIPHNIGYDMYYVAGDDNDPAVGVRLREITIREYKPF